VLKGMSDKLEPNREVYLRVGYPKGTRVGLFYSLEDRKVFVSTNYRLLEDDHLNELK
jgi:hypothetical protein